MRRKLILVFTVLILSASLIFAASAESLYSDFSSAAAEGDVEAAITAYDSLKEQLEKEMEDLQSDMKKAREKNDRTLYNNSVAELKELSSYTMSEADSDNLLRAIVNSDSSDAATWASWLYSNSRYYRPTLTIQVSVESGRYSNSMKQNVTVAPGSEITLPAEKDIKVNSSAGGVLVGWGIVPDEVLYQPGETITMPYTDQTLYAIFASRVAFSDSLTGDVQTYDNVAEGDVIAVPTPAERDDAFFEGWYDSSSGQYLAPDDTEYTVRGMGASFEALYIKAEASSITTGHYDVNSIPTATQIPLSFTVKNDGTEDLKNLNISVTSDSEYVRILNSFAYMRTMRAGRTYNFGGPLMVVSQDAPSGTSLPITVTITDGDGHVFTSSFTLTSR